MHSDPGYWKATDPDMALGSGLGLKDIMGTCGNPGLSDQLSPSGCMALGHLQGPRLWPKSQASMQPLVAIWAMDINSDPGYCRTMDSDMVLSRSLGPGCHQGPRGKCRRLFFLNSFCPNELNALSAICLNTECETQYTIWACTETHNIPTSVSQSLEFQESPITSGLRVVSFHPHLRD